MVLAHNLTAMNAQRQFNIVGTSKKKSTEKLASGYKINRAADDAAGLTISEKMRSQIRGLHQASENCQDGVSLCQVADGALTETHDILQRMNELAIKSANGTNTDADREAIQKEVKQLTDEFDRIANSTSYNDKIYPLNAKQTSSPMLEKRVTLTLVNGGEVNGVVYNPGDKVNVTGIASPGADGIILKNLRLQNSQFSASDNSYVITSSSIKTSNLGFRDLYKYSNGNVCYTGRQGNSIRLMVGNGRLDHSGHPEVEINSVKFLDTGVNIQAGAQNREEQRIPINFVDATKEGLKLTEPEIDVSTKDGALSAIDRVANAIDIVSGYRSYFGATQNRLEHTIANLDNIVENTQAAESRIRDTDMATEMVNNTKLNVLEQAVTSMMAQANQSTQGVLSLLK